MTLPSHGGPPTPPPGQRVRSPRRLGPLVAIPGLYLRDGRVMLVAEDSEPAYRRMLLVCVTRSALPQRLSLTWMRQNGIDGSVETLATRNNASAAHALQALIDPWGDAAWRTMPDFGSAAVLDLTRQSGMRVHVWGGTVEAYAGKLTYRMWKQPGHARAQRWAATAEDQASSRTVRTQTTPGPMYAPSRGLGPVILSSLLIAEMHGGMMDVSRGQNLQCVLERMPIETLQMIARRPSQFSHVMSAHVLAPLLRHPDHKVRRAGKRMLANLATMNAGG